MRIKKVFNVLIIGAGDIGALYDSPGSEEVLTHAHAFSAHPGFTLAGFIDKDITKAQHAANTWGGKAFASIDEAFSNSHVDIVCVAVPDEHHYPLLKELSYFPLKLIFSEKPLAATLNEAIELEKIFHSNKTPVLINYRRRFVPEFEKLRDDISTGKYGRYVTGNGIYGKGFFA